MHNPTAILITGASSGIGAELAKQYAAPGRHLFLGGRDHSRLDSVAKTCTKAGANVQTRAIDVADAAAMAAWITDMDSHAAIDLVIANAGISAGTGGGGGESADQARQIFATNLDGVLNTVHPALTMMQSRPRPAQQKGPAEPRGQIAIMSSLASFRGFAGAPAYSASKAAIRVYAESLRNSLAGDAIEVSAICPGFIRSPMTDVNDFTMPFLMDVDRAAGIIRRGLARNHGRIAFPWPMYALVWLLGALPPRLTDPGMRRLPAKTGPAPLAHSKH
ncbi:MAG: SDR family NAD(P)-dependent oxidoreductase [Alphaproteobacteria bacterium]